jgi:hypothetical protein
LFSAQTQVHTSEPTGIKIKSEFSTPLSVAWFLVWLCFHSIWTPQWDTNWLAHWASGWRVGCIRVQRDTGPNEVASHLMVFQVFLCSCDPTLWAVLTQLGLQGEMDQLIWQSSLDSVSTTTRKSVLSQVLSHWTEGELDPFPGTSKRSSIGQELLPERGRKLL